jgi:hypothetical protein
MTLNIQGNPNGGLFNYVSVDQTLPISTYNASLCAVIGISNSLGVLQVYRPSSSLNPFTDFIAGSGYIVLAHQNFTINTSTPLPSPTPTSTPVIPNLSQTPTPTPTVTPTSTPAASLSSAVIDVVFDNYSIEWVPNYTSILSASTMSPFVTSGNPTVDYKLYENNFTDTNQITNFYGSDWPTLKDHMAGQVWTWMTASAESYNGQTINTNDKYRIFISPSWHSQYNTIVYAQQTDDHYIQWVYQSVPGTGNEFKVCSNVISVAEVYEDKYGLGSWSSFGAISYFNNLSFALDKSDVLPISLKRVTDWTAVDFNEKSPWTVAHLRPPSLSSVQAWADTLSFAVS